MTTIRPSKIVALVVAAGRGERARRGVPKQFALLGGKPMLRRTIEAIERNSRVGAIAVVIHPDDRGIYEQSVTGLAKLVEPIAGGATRQASVRRGLEALAGMQPDIVLIHDAARPFVGIELIDRVIDTTLQGTGAVPALPVTDTLRRVTGTAADETVPRQGLSAIQTPQGFRFDIILEAHREADPESGFSDDAAVATAAGYEIVVVAGDPQNVKLTNPEDFFAAEQRLQTHLETRSGQGFDVHAFAPGDGVWLCGIKVSHEMGLAGHSDADVGLHALTDAILGAIADGDIGEHFPPTDLKWKDFASDGFLRDAVRRVEALGGRIVNLDVTIVCERPKIGPHRAAMRERIAEIAGIPASRVSVKATTSERLGFTGRGEGIAALALATVALPANE